MFAHLSTKDCSVINSVALTLNCTGALPKDSYPPTINSYYERNVIGHNVMNRLSIYYVQGAEDGGWL